MKVFVSHSSADRWIARRISQDLNDLGVETFLDEKDIETGDSIDSSVHAHLKDCDEMLILLSPAALASSWVLIEIGGAMALEKRLVPILLHTGPNDLPRAIANGLARDINEVEKYYAEAKKRMAGSTPRLREDKSRRLAASDAPAKRRFEVGDTVRIPDQRQTTHFSRDINVGWNPAMDEYLGRTARVSRMGPGRTVHLDIDPGWTWAMDWLEPA